MTLIITQGYGPVPSGGGGGGGAIDPCTLAVADLGDGTGATATITNSDSGSTDHDIYVGTWSGELGAVTFALEASRTGNGTASLTLTPGYYWAYVLSEDDDAYAVSNFVYFQVTDDEDPIHDQCARAVQSVIQGLALSGLLSASVIVRKFPHHNKDTDPLPAIVISTHLPTQHGASTNLSDDVIYPVTVNFVSASNANNTVNQERMLAWRQAVRKAFHQKRLSGVPSVWNCNVPPSPPFDPAWFIGGMRDVSPLTLNFISREQRN